MHWIDNKHYLCSVERGSIQCTNQNRNLHISKIGFLFPVSLTIEHKVGIAEFYLYMGFAADLLKMWSPEPENCRNRNPHNYKIANYFREIQQTRKSKKINKKCNVQVFMAKCNNVQNQYYYINISLIHANT